MAGDYCITLNGKQEKVHVKRVTDALFYKLLNIHLY
jgi:hypothetical protein